MSRYSLPAFLDQLVASGTATAAVALVATPEEVVWRRAVGEARSGVPADRSTVFDFASLTKPFVATLAQVLDERQILPLSLPIGEVWPQADRLLADQPLENLLRHKAGMAGWAPLYTLCKSEAEIVQLLLDPSRSGRRWGLYSDLDFMLWGLSAERVLGSPLAARLRDHVLAPLRLDGVVPAPGDQPGVAECRMDTGKEVELAARQRLTIAPLGPPAVGEPQDGNARFARSLGKGLLGSAGLFGRADDLWRLGAEWLAPDRLLTGKGVAAALGGVGSLATGRSRFVLGWWRRTLHGSSGESLAAASFGHTGFAGGSLWIDPRKRRIFALLSHRTEPSSDINWWRRRFHTLAQRTLDEPRLWELYGGNSDERT
jgi:CubicO group peptidase (beta-lactamase class C family)